MSGESGGLLARDGAPVKPIIGRVLSSARSARSDSGGKSFLAALKPTSSLPYETLKDENLLKVVQLANKAAHGGKSGRRSSQAPTPPRPATTKAASPDAPEPIAAKANRQALKSCSFRTYQYPTRKAPSFDLFRLFAKAAATGPRSLRLLIPDTVVYGLRQDGGPTWLYTDAEGMVRTSNAFSEKQIIDRLGNRRYEDDLVVVSKEPKYLPQANGSVRFDGNEASVVSTRMLKLMLLETHALQGNALILQRYIKSKGGKARIVRSAWYARRPSRVWLISNRSRYTDEPTGDHRDAVRDMFMTHTQKQSSVSVYDVTGSAKEDFVEKNLKVLAFLEMTMKKRLDELVLDCIKDDFDQVWVLQVKAYKVHTPEPGSEQTRTKDAVLSDDDSLSDNGKRIRSGTGGGGPLHPGAQLQDSKGPAHIGHGHSGLFNRKCRFCSVVYPLHELRYRMTTQMILDTTAHLKARIPAARYKALLASQAGGDLGVDPSRLYYAHQVCSTCFSLYDQEKELALTESLFARALGMPVPVHPALDTSDDMLKCGGDRVSRDARGASGQGLAQNGGDNPSANDEDEDDKATSNVENKSGQTSAAGRTRADLNSVRLSPLGSPTSGENRIKNALLGMLASPKAAPGSILQRSQSRLTLLSPTGDAGGRMSAMMSKVIKKAFRQGDKKSAANGLASPSRPGQPAAKSISDVAGSMPRQVTLCRCMIAVHELHDLPPELVNRLVAETKQNGASTILRCSVLNKEYDIPVKLSKNSTSTYRDRTSSILPLHVFRVYSFFSGDTPANGPLPEGSGVAQLIQNQRKIDVAMLHGVKGNWIELGRGSVPLEQFRSDFVKSLEMFVPLGGKVGLGQVKVSVGIERTRSRVDSSTIRGVKFFQGVYVPNSMFHTGDPLPSEWMTTLQMARPQVLREEDESYGNDRTSHRSLAANALDASRQAHSGDRGSNDHPSDGQRGGIAGRSDGIIQNNQHRSESISESELGNTSDVFDEEPPETLPVKLSVQTRGMSFRHSNPLSPSPGVSLPANRQDSVLYKKLNGEETVAMNRALGLPPGSELARKPSFARGLSLTARNEGSDGEGGVTDVSGASNNGKPNGLLRRSMSVKSLKRTPSIRKPTSRHAEVFNNDMTDENECIWSLRLKIESAHNVSLSKDLKPYKRWHVYFDLFNQRHRTSVATLSNGTLVFNYSRDHYVWATKASLKKYFERHRPVKLKLARSMELDQSRRLDMLEAVFKVTDSDGNGCVTRAELLEVLAHPKDILLMMEGKYVKPVVASANVGGQSGVAARRRAVAAEAAKKQNNATGNNNNNGNNAAKPAVPTVQPQIQDGEESNRRATTQDTSTDRGSSAGHKDHKSPLRSLHGPLINTLALSLQELWRDQPNSVAALEACTISEFNSIGSLVLHFHDMFTRARDGGTSTSAAATVAGASKGRQTMCSLDKLVQVLDAQEGHGVGLNNAIRERKVIELCRGKLEDPDGPRGLDWMSFLNWLKDAALDEDQPDAFASSRFTGSSEAKRAMRQDKEWYSCLMPLTRLISNPDATVEDTFDLVCKSQKQDPSEVSRRQAAQLLQQCCTQVSDEHGTDIVPMQAIRDACNQRAKETKSGEGAKGQDTILSFLDAYYDEGNTQCDPPTTSHGVAGSTSSDDENGGVAESERALGELRVGQHITNGDRDDDDDDDDILSSSRSESEYSADFDKEFLRAEWSSSDMQSDTGVASRKSSMASLAPPGGQVITSPSSGVDNRGTSTHATQQTNTQLVNVKTLLQAFALLQARERRQAVSSQGQSPYPSYMCTAARLQRTENRREAMSPSRNASLARLDKNGDVL